MIFGNPLGYVMSISISMPSFIKYMYYYVKELGQFHFCLNLDLDKAATNLW